jgi:hypothetical protein
VPSYAASFGAFSNHVILDQPLTGDADRDASNVLDAIRAGRVFASIDGAVSNGALEVTAVSGTAVARVGESIASASPIRIEVALTGPAGTSIRVLRNGVPIHEGTASAVSVEVGTAPAAYRVEAHLPKEMDAPPVPWLLTNPIYVNLPTSYTAPAVSAPEKEISRALVQPAAWHTEASADSQSHIVVGTGVDRQGALTWRLSLRDGPAVSQFAALALPLDREMVTSTRVVLRARADRHMRLSAQLRLSPQRGGLRWAKSFHLGPEVETIDLSVEDFRPVEPMTSERPPMGDVEGLLIVADTLNTLPGTAAVVTVEGVWLVK